MRTPFFYKPLLAQFHQDPVGSPGMKKTNQLVIGARPGFFKNKIKPFLFQASDLRLNVFHLECDMMNAFPPFLNKPAKNAVVSGSFQQLKFADRKSVV